MVAESKLSHWRLLTSGLLLAQVSTALKQTHRIQSAIGRVIPAILRDGITCSNGLWIYKLSYCIQNQR